MPTGMAARMATTERAPAEGTLSRWQGSYLLRDAINANGPYRRDCVARKVAKT
jgi:hypothetical protein